MKEYQSANLRNVAIVGHGKTGKTSLLEACLFDSGAVKRLGKIDDGTAVLDYEPEESKRKQSISCKPCAVEWRDYKLNFIDSPGYPDFIGDVRGAMAAADSALIVISASSGINAGTETGWQVAEEFGLPRAFFINKMDREHADFNGIVEELRVRFGKGVVPIQLPIGKEAAFQGVADLLALHMKILTHNEEDLIADIPEYMQGEVDDARDKLIEAIAEFNDELLEKYIGGEEITETETAAALIEGIQAGKIFPVFCGSALQNIGVKKLMNGIVEYLPTPYFKVSIGTDPQTGDIAERKTEDALSAQVWKTIVDPFVGRLSYLRILSGDMKGDATYLNSSCGQMERVGAVSSMQGKNQENLKVAHAGDIVVVAKLNATKTGDTLCDKDEPIRYDPITYPESMLVMAVKAKKKGEEEKVFSSIQKEHEQDPTIVLQKQPETKDTLVRGIGEVHLEVLADRILRKFGAEAVFGEPKIPYRETIQKSVKAEGKHKKQSGGHGQYGHVFLELTPQPAGTGNEFTESIFGGSVPRQYIPAVEKGTEETLAQGVYAGYPVVDVKVNLFDGSYHAVDSSEAAFKTATAIALKKGIMEASPVLLEPIWNITVTAPEYYMGDVMGRLNAKHAKIMGMDSKGRDMSEVKAQIPAAALYKYATELRSQTKGRGSFSVEFSHYQKMQQRDAEAVIAKREEEKEQAAKK